MACPDAHGPAEVLANKVRDAVWAASPRRGRLRFGRVLPRLLRDAGLTGINAQARIPLTGPDTVRFQRTLVLRHRERMLAVGLLTSGEFGQHVADLADGPLTWQRSPWSPPGATSQGNGRPSRNRAGKALLEYLPATLSVVATAMLIACDPADG